MRTTYDVDVSPPHLTLYTDPYKGNEIKVGGFSSLYPVPGTPGSFYTITDRGPAPDLVDGRVTRKTFAIPRFGPHLGTLHLMPDLSAVINDVKPLKRPTGGPGSHITGLPTSLPFTDTPFYFDLNQLSFDEDSLDAEGVTMDPWGFFGTLWRIVLAQRATVLSAGKTACYWKRCC